MRKTILILFLQSIITISYCQSAAEAPPTEEQVDEKPDIVFTLAEVMPTYKGDETALEKYLNENISGDSLTKNETAVYIFVVGKDGKIHGVQNYINSKPLSFDYTLIKVISQSEGNWNSALQNSRKVPAYARVKIKVKEKKISVSIFKNGNKAFN